MRRASAAVTTCTNFGILEKARKRNSKVQAGLPSPAVDHAQKRVDFIQHIINSRTASYLFRHTKYKSYQAKSRNSFLLLHFFPPFLNIFASQGLRDSKTGGEFLAALCLSERFFLFPLFILRRLIYFSRIHLRWWDPNKLPMTIY